MYEFWYYYVKPKHSENAKLCYKDTDSFIVHVKTENIYTNIAKDVGTRFGGWWRTKKRFKSTWSFLTMIAQNSFCCEEKLFILMIHGWLSKV